MAKPRVGGNSYPMVHGVRPMLMSPEEIEMKVRITIEYDTDTVGDTLEEVRQDWTEGAIGFMDLDYLAKSGDQDVKVTFEEVRG